MTEQQMMDAKSEWGMNERILTAYCLPSLQQLGKVSQK